MNLSSKKRKFDREPTTDTCAAMDEIRMDGSKISTSNMDSIPQQLKVTHVGTKRSVNMIDLTCNDGEENDDMSRTTKARTQDSSDSVSHDRENVVNGCQVVNSCSQGTQGAESTDRKITNPGTAVDTEMRAQQDVKYTNMEEKKCVEKNVDNIKQNSKQHTLSIIEQRVDGARWGAHAKRTRIPATTSKQKKMRKSVPRSHKRKKSTVKVNVPAYYVKLSPRPENIPKSLFQLLNRTNFSAYDMLMMAMTMKSEGRKCTIGPNSVRIPMYDNILVATDNPLFKSGIVENSRPGTPSLSVVTPISQSCIASTNKPIISTNSLPGAWSKQTACTAHKPQWQPQLQPKPKPMPQSQLHKHPDFHADANGMLNMKSYVVTSHIHVPAYTPSAEPHMPPFINQVNSATKVPQQTHKSLEFRGGAYPRSFLPNPLLSTTTPLSAPFVLVQNKSSNPFPYSFQEAQSQPQPHFKPTQAQPKKTHIPFENSIPSPTAQICNTSNHDYRVQQQKPYTHIENLDSSSATATKTKSNATDLFVCGLPNGWTVSGLRREFTRFGDVVDATLYYRETDGTPIYGFVTLDSRMAAYTAARKMNGMRLGGRKICVRVKARVSSYCSHSKFHVKLLCCRMVLSYFCVCGTFIRKRSTIMATNLYPFEDGGGEIR
eukprot:CFRG0899T1